MFGRWRKPKVLVVGSALVDTVAERYIHDPADLFKGAEADISNSIGGSSYNIAVNLALGGARGGVGLFSYLPPNTTTTQLIVQRLKQLGVSTRYVRQERKVNNFDVTTGGFVAIRDRENKQLFIFGVEEVMGAHDLMAAPEEERFLHAAIARCKAVVIDTGLHPSSVTRIMQIAKDKSVPIFVHLVSASKVSSYARALTGVGHDYSSLCVIGKPPELDALHKALGAPEADHDAFIRRYSSGGGECSGTLDIPTVCDRLRAQHILVAPKTVEAAYLLQADPQGERPILHGLRMPGRGGSLLGVSEAVGSALIHCYCAQGRGDRANGLLGIPDGTLRNAATAFGLRATSSLGATPLSTISAEIDDSVLRWYVRLRRRLEMAHSVVSIVTIAWLVVAVAGLYIGLKIYHPKLSGP